MWVTLASAYLICKMYISSVALQVICASLCQSIKVKKNMYIWHENNGLNTNEYNSGLCFFTRPQLCTFQPAKLRLSLCCWDCSYEEVIACLSRFYTEQTSSWGVEKPINLRDMKWKNAADIIDFALLTSELITCMPQPNRTTPWHVYIKEYKVKPVYNDHLMGYLFAFWSSSRWPRAT